jgi:gliding motility-associated-like protein
MESFNWAGSYRISNPNFLYDKNMEYLITITSQAGCITKDTQLVVVNSPAQIIGSGIFVPKAWTPNGDGHNDVLVPYAVNISSIKYFRIFNRWGQLVFSATGMSQGWNGIFKGIAQPIEVYTWIIEATGVDGKNYKFSGNSVLIR